MEFRDDTHPCPHLLVYASHRVGRTARRFHVDVWTERCDMSDPSVRTTQLHLWLERMRAGDVGARDELLRGFCGRLESLAHKMLRRFPHVQRWAQTDDVLQNALMRLLRSL